MLPLELGARTVDLAKTVGNGLTLCRCHAEYTVCRGNVVCDVTARWHLIAMAELARVSHTAAYNTASGGNATAVAQQRDQATFAPGASAAFAVIAKMTAVTRFASSGLLM